MKADGHAGGLEGFFNVREDPAALSVEVVTGREHARNEQQLRDNLAAALRFYDAAETEFEFLADVPGAGPRLEPRIESFPNARFWPIKRYRNYLVLYQATAEEVAILRVVHGARDIATALNER